MKAKLFAVAVWSCLAGLVLGNCNYDPLTDPAHVNNVPAQRGFDTVRYVQLPAARSAYILRDQVSGRCFILSVLSGSTSGGVLQEVSNDVCAT